MRQVLCDTKNHRDQHLYLYEYIDTSELYGTATHYKHEIYSRSEFLSKFCCVVERHCVF